MKKTLRFDKKEIFELLIAWILISIAFTILFANPIVNGISPEIFALLIICLFTAGFGFLIHELAHKFFAERYNCETRFKADYRGLLFALLLSFFGLIFAAPGAVHIKGNITKRQNGIISAAGPVSNLIVSIAFLLVGTLIGGPLGRVMSYGFVINAWIGLFNMIPVPPFDGAKVWAWSKAKHIVISTILLMLVVYSFIWAPAIQKPKKNIKIKQFITLRLRSSAARAADFWAEPRKLQVVSSNLIGGLFSQKIYKQHLQINNKLKKHNLHTESIAIVVIVAIVGVVGLIAIITISSMTGHDLTGQEVNINPTTGQIVDQNVVGNAMKVHCCDRSCTYVCDDCNNKDESCQKTRIA